MLLKNITARSHSTAPVMGHARHNRTRRRSAAQIPGARLSLYDGVGHSPFFEDPTRFNRELAALVRAADA